MQRKTDREGTMTRSQMIAELGVIQNGLWAKRIPQDILTITAYMTDVQVMAHLEAQRNRESTR